MDEKADPMLGRVLDGRYRIEHRIARGGMAMVYVATDLRLQRVVAVKVMHEPLAADPTFVVRFEREARSAAKLSHPNAVAVFDQGDDHGTLFLVMEYVPGVTLRDLIRREAPLPPALALRIMESVLAALSAAHRIGIVHRDIKPENVLLATAEIDKMDPRHTKVADFGLARAVNAETQHTATGGVIIGTVSYLAPEMLVNATADERVDVYAAGVLLYELLTGKKPHQAENPIQVAYMHVHEDIGKPSDEVRGIPPYLDALVARATARDADQRPADASVLLHHVQRVRQAIEAGVIDDPDLTADLMPRGTTEEDTAAAGIPGWNGGSLEAPVGYEATAQLEPVSMLPMAESERPRPRPARPQRRRLRLWLAVLVLLLTIGSGSVGGWYYFVYRYTHAPSVLNKTQDQALAILKKAELQGKVAQQAYSAVVAKGLVIDEIPGVNSRVLKNSTINLVISLGKPVVPQLVGLPQADATAKLAGVELQLGEVKHAFSDTVAAGIVISSSPTDGTPLAPNQPVSITVSDGPAPVTIPNFSWQSAKAPGEPTAQATKDLQALGLKVVTDSTQTSWTVPSGSIISQNPAGAQGHRGDTIHLVVSSGLPLVTVPDVTGKSWSAAVATLAGACTTPMGAPCFKAAAGNAKATLAQEVWTVYQANIGSAKRAQPGAGAQAPAGSTVTLYF